MWTVYCRTNLLSNKKYVGVTRNSLEERWKIELKNAAEYWRIKEKYEKLPEGSLQEKRYAKRLARMKTTMFYDVATMGGGNNIWEHDVLFQHENLCFALLAERYYVDLFNTQDPSVGYNRSPGGEVPPWLNVVDVLEAARMLDVKQVTSFLVFAQTGRPGSATSSPPPGSSAGGSGP